MKLNGVTFTKDDITSGYKNLKVLNTGITSEMSIVEKESSITHGM